MEYSTILHSLSQTISGQSADLDEKISRLKKAKTKVENEQEASLNEIKIISRPELGVNWEGERSIEFENERQHSYDEMERIFHIEVENYLSQIQWKIDQLELQRSALNFASMLANEAGDLLKKGEEAYAAIENKINQIRERLW